MSLNLAFSPSVAEPVGKDIRQAWARAFGLDQVSLAFREVREGKVLRAGRLERGTFFPSLLLEYPLAEWTYEVPAVTPDVRNASFWERIIPYPFNRLGSFPQPAFRDRVAELESLMARTEMTCLTARVGEWSPPPLLAHFVRGQCQRVSTFPELVELVQQTELDPAKLKDFFGTQSAVIHLDLSLGEDPLSRLENALKQAPILTEFRLTSEDSKPFTL